MDWEELLQQSREYEQRAIAAQEENNQAEAKRLLKLAAFEAEKALEIIPNPADRGIQAVRTVNLRREAGQPKKAKTLAQSWLARNSLPEEFVSQLRQLIVVATNDMTAAVANNRRIDSSSQPMTNPSDNPESLVAPVAENLFEEVKQKILALPAPNLREKAAKALQASIIVDVENEAPRPKSPRQIAEDIGLPISVQRELGICLTKDDAFAFLQRLRIYPKKGSFRRRLTKEAYESFFKREICSDGRKPFVFTYAEILHFEEIEAFLPFPESLIDLLN